MNDFQKRGAVAVVQYLMDEASKTNVIFQEMYVEHKNRHEEVPPRIYKGMSRTKDIMSVCYQLQKLLAGQPVKPEFAGWIETAPKETA